MRFNIRLKFEDGQSEVYQGKLLLPAMMWLEKEVILRAVHRYRTKIKAAKELGILRTTLIYKLKRYYPKLIDSVSEPKKGKARKRNGKRRSVSRKNQKNS